jgi:hypothetical protein
MKRSNDLANLIIGFCLTVSRTGFGQPVFTPVHAGVFLILDKFSHVLPDLA